MSDVDERVRRITIATIAVGAVLLWLPHLGRSLWLDETGTYWVISDGLPDAVDRATRFQGQSPLYFILEWGARQVGGGNEIVLRLPSILFMAAAAALLYRLAARLTDRTSALVTLAVFVTSWKIVGEADDARPYAFGMFAIIGAMLSLVRWLDSGRVRDGAAYVVLAALTLYAHYLFGIMFVVHAIYAIEARRSGKSVTWRHIAAATVGISVLLLPLVPQFLAVLSKRGTYSWTGTPGLRSLAIALVPPVTAIGAVAGLAAARVIAKARWERPARPPAFLIAWWLLPVLVLFAVSRLTATKIFAPQYVLAAEPAIALLVGWIVRGLAPAFAATLVAAALTLSTCASHFVKPPVDEDWRGAVAEINALPGDPVAVMCACGFVEASHLEWLTDPERVSFLNAPLAAYPPKGPVMRLPGDVVAEPLRNYADAQLASFVESRKRVAFLSRGEDPSWREWLDKRLGPLGFERHALGSHAGLYLLVYERATP